MQLKREPSSKAEPGAAAPKIPLVLRRRFPFGALHPFPYFMNVAPGCCCVSRMPRPNRTLQGLVIRFGGKRLRAVDVQRMELRAAWGNRQFPETVWRADASVARMLNLYREGRRTPRRYVFIDFTDPHQRDAGGWALGALHVGEMLIDLAPEVVAPTIEWWGVLSWR